MLAFIDASLIQLTAAAPPPAEPHVISLKLTNRKRQASEAGLEELDAPPTIRLRQPADLSAPTDGLFSDDAEDQEEEDYEEEAPAKRLTKKQGGAASKRSRAGSKTKGAVTSPPVVNKMAQIIAERQAKAKAQKEAEEEEDTAAMTASERLKNASRSIIGVRAKDIFSMTSSPSTSRPVSRLPPKKSTPIAKGHRPPMTPSTTQKDEPVPKKPDLPTSQSDIIAMYAQKKREKEEREREAEVARQNQRQMEARLAETKKRQQAQALEQARLEEEKRQRLLFLEEERQRKAQSFATEVYSTLFFLNRPVRLMGNRKRMWRV